MTSSISSWTVPIFGFVLGILIALSMLGSDATPAEAAIAFAFVAGYAIILKLLQTRSDVASLLSGMPRDERWESINLRALSLSAQVIAIALVGAFLITQFGGADATPYAWLGALFAATSSSGASGTANDPEAIRGRADRRITAPTDPSGPNLVESRVVEQPPDPS